jgi:hypothetical protein
MKTTNDDGRNKMMDEASIGILDEFGLTIKESGIENFYDILDDKGDWLTSVPKDYAFIWLAGYQAALNRKENQ